MGVTAKPRSGRTPKPAQAPRADIPGPRRTPSSKTYATAKKDGDSTEAKAVGIGEAEAGAASIGSGSTSDGAEVKATAEATYNPYASTAQATTKEEHVLTTKATAVWGAAPDTYTSCGGSSCAKEVNKTTSKKSVAIAVNADGSYSVAMAGKKSSFAQSGIYSGDLQTFSGRDIMAAARAAASAYAKAGQNYAEAGAKSWGKGSSSAGHKTWSNAWAGSSSYARVGPAPKKDQHPLVASVGVQASCEWRPQRQLLYCYRYK